MGTILKYALIGGAGYGIHRVCTAISGAFAVCFGVLLVICVVFLIGGLFDFEYDDVTIHNLLALIGGVCALGIIGMALSGQWFGALIALCVVLGVMGVCKPTVTAFLDRWDTPDRRFQERLESGCDTYYLYSKVDGYCHFNHQYHEDSWRLPRSGYVETMVPMDTDYVNTEGLLNPPPKPIRGALENIARLKAATTPKAASAAPATVVTPEAPKRSFFDDVIHNVTRPLPWIFMVSFSALAICLEHRTNPLHARPRNPHWSLRHTLGWLRDGRPPASTRSEPNSRLPLGGGHCPTTFFCPEFIAI